MGLLPPELSAQVPFGGQPMLATQPIPREALDTVLMQPASAPLHTHTGHHSSATRQATQPLPLINDGISLAPQQQLLVHGQGQPLRSAPPQLAPQSITQHYLQQQQAAGQPGVYQQVYACAGGLSMWAEAIQDFSLELPNPPLP